jgi:hypothetical protein
VLSRHPILAAHASGNLTLCESMSCEAKDPSSSCCHSLSAFSWGLMHLDLPSLIGKYYSYWPEASSIYIVIFFVKGMPDD